MSIKSKFKLAIVAITLATGFHMIAVHETRAKAETAAPSDAVHAVEPVDPAAPPVDEVAPPAEIPDAPQASIPAWLRDLLDYLMEIPAVGPYLVLLLQWMGALASILTLLSSLILAIKKFLESVGKKLPYADKVLEWVKIVYPYVAWLSMYNVQKKKD